LEWDAKQRNRLSNNEVECQARKWKAKRLNRATSNEIERQVIK